MKSILTFIVLLFTTSSFSQEYTFKKIVTDGYVVKMKGDVSITDTLITVKMNNLSTRYPVQVAFKTGEFTQYSMNTNGQIQVRITFQPNMIDNKTEKFTLNFETKDTFTNKLSSSIYFLIPKQLN